MKNMNQLSRSFLLAAVVGTAALAFGQDAQDAPPAGQQPSATGAPVITAEDADLAAEIQRLRNDVDRLKRQVAYLNSVVEDLQAERVPVERAAATKPSPKPTKKSGASTKSSIPSDAPATTPELDEKVTKTVLVFRDGHKTEATNYAIVGQTLWIYTEQDSKKVPLADLDVAATKAANSDRGVTFQVPPTK